jgi:hypothetical protein
MYFLITIDISHTYITQFFGHELHKMLLLMVFYLLSFM